MSGAFRSTLCGAKIVDVHVDSEISYIVLDNGIVITIPGAWMMRHKDAPA